MADAVADAISYIDTSALLKWYVHEPASDKVAVWIQTQPLLAFSRLGWLELRGALNRRVRTGNLPGSTAAEALQRFGADVEAGAFTLLPLSDDQALVADELLARVRLPLRTLDALHLAVAVSLRVANLATADRVLAAAAGSLDLTVSFFGNPE